MSPSNFVFQPRKGRRGLHNGRMFRVSRLLRKNRPRVCRGLEDTGRRGLEAGRRGLCCRPPRPLRPCRGAGGGGGGGGGILLGVYEEIGEARGAP